jgi:hypothetical protein
MEMEGIELTDGSSYRVRYIGDFIWALEIGLYIILLSRFLKLSFLLMPCGFFIILFFKAMDELFGSNLA